MGAKGTKDPCARARLQRRWQERPAEMKAVLAKANREASARCSTRWTNDPAGMAKIAKANAAKGSAKLTGTHFSPRRRREHSAALTGRLLGGEMARGARNCRARYFALGDPEGNLHRGRNLLHFVRTHPALFDAEDLIEKRGTNRAAKQLSRLRPGSAGCKQQWKGWVWL